MIRLATSGVAIKEQGAPAAVSETNVLNDEARVFNRSVIKPRFRSVAPQRFASSFHAHRQARKNVSRWKTPVA